MIKEYVRQTAIKFGYDFIKSPHFEYGRKFKRTSPDPKFDYYQTPSGNYYLPKNCKGDAVANAIKAGKFFDEDIFEAARPFIIPNSIVLDVGAHYGQMAIEFSKLSDNVTVLAFEAQKMVFEVLERNLSTNHVKNVKPFYSAVYDVDNVEFLFPVPDLVRFTSYGSYGLDLKATSGVPVKSLTIDSLRFDAPVSFMKIDIQGSDLAAMRGAVKTITEHRMPIIFEYEEQFQQEFGTTFQDYVEFVDEIGYKFSRTIQNINYLIVPR